MHRKLRKVKGRIKDLQPRGPNPSDGPSLGYMPYQDHRGRLRMGKGLGRASMVLQQDRNELQLANHITEKWGSLCLCLSCHPLSFRNVSFDHSVAQPSYTESVKVWAMIIRREPRG